MHPSIESTAVHNTSIGSAMASILISQLIGQMRGTSHESRTTWVGCMLGAYIGEGEPSRISTNKEGIIGEEEPFTLYTMHQ